VGSTRGDTQDPRYRHLEGSSGGNRLATRGFSTLSVDNDFY